MRSSCGSHGGHTSARRRCIPQRRHGRGMIAGEESVGLLVRGFVLRTALGARPRSLLHGRDRDHGMGRHDPVVTVSDPDAPESAPCFPPRADSAPQHDDDLRHRVAGRDVEQPRLDGDPIAQTGRRRAHGIAVRARIAWRFRRHDVRSHDVLRQEACHRISAEFLSKLCRPGLQRCKLNGAQRQASSPRAGRGASSWGRDDYFVRTRIGSSPTLIIFCSSALPPGAASTSRPIPDGRFLGSARRTLVLFCIAAGLTLQASSRERLPNPSLHVDAARGTVHAIARFQLKSR
jgi:hypothetical protein